VDEVAIADTAGPDEVAGRDEVEPAQPARVMATAVAAIRVRVVLLMSTIAPRMRERTVLTM
jgi:hypothetical protein